MKVFHINTCGTLSTGGIASDIIRKVIENGGDGVLAYARLGAATDIRTIQIGTKIDVYVHAFLSRISDRSGFYSKRATKALIQKIMDENPDLIHLHNLHGYYLNIELLFDFLKSINKPVVWTLHDCWAFTGHCPHFTAQGCYKWEKECFECPLKTEYPASMVLDQSRRNYNDKKRIFTGVNNLTIVTPSHWLARMVEGSFLGGYKCIPIYNGVNPEIFYPRKMGAFRQKYGLEDKEIVLGVASTWSPQKGYDDFIKLAGMVGENVRLVLVGLSQRQIEKLPPNALGFTRTSSVEELAEMYTDADIYFNASIEETMGLTTIEAIMCGTPAIVYDSTAVPECVDSATGYILPARKVELVAELINKKVWKEFPEKLECSPLFYKEHAYKDYYELYQEILAKI